MAIDTTEFRPKLKIEIDGVPFRIVASQFVKPGKGVAFYKVKMKNLLTGGVQERNFRSGDKVDSPDIQDKTMQYLYSDDEAFHFMDQTSYDQVAIPKEAIGDAWQFLKEETVVEIMFYKGRAIDIDLPNFVVLSVTETVPAVKGDTVQGASKPATLATGAVIQVPLFINEGDALKIDTRDGTYVERSKG